MHFTTPLLWVITLILGMIAYFHPEKLHKQGLKIAWEQALSILPRMVMALLVSGFISVLIPTELVATWLGKDSGIKGILIACLLGAVTPGGPIISFPFAVVLFKTGAGVSPLIAFLTAWSIFAAHRMFAYEIPMMGLRFTGVRILSSFLLPPLTGIAASIIEANCPIGI
jgi:uncharacterized membrane protein YraQ (UPF0718 family)